MVKIATFLVVAAIAACTLFDSTTAHEDHTRRALSTDERRLFVQSAQAALTTCTKTTVSRQLQERAVVRRAEAVAKLRQEIHQRRLNSHLSTLTVTTGTNSSVLFASTTTYIVEPEVTEGPYYIKGEYIRTDMREKQTGVPMYIDVQVIDVNTCKPVTNMYVDLWHTNATGVYSGVVASTNGNSNDASNLQNTFLRGVTPTDSEGVAQMTSIFPGHYAGRTTHMHFVGNYGGTVLANKTYSGGSVAHVGQFFFEQDLITSVEKVSPYSTNTQAVTLNSADNIYKSASTNGFDPVFNYALLGSTVDQGVFVWISIAVDMTAKQSPRAVSTYTGTGSDANSTTTGTSDNAAPRVTGLSASALLLLVAFAPVLLGIL
ncbi:hypothetical protein P3T76_006217 [Phytophthora citrophthora]|uniref:Intradiol ring-cleavage dioxygenases domain-containing protein n=1 Tax=Phytophthora citrophthora TaxID=4793 RepID=A0AAD9GR41_9STRA|nr:hypothetical protein P3T76_006217 [Phytophthora citrophthora]